MLNEWVLVTTKHRGVFFGKLIHKSEGGDTVTLNECQMATYWSRECHGVFGLAADGPVSGCRIGPPCETQELRGITSIAKCSDGAMEKWKAQPWS